MTRIVVLATRNAGKIREIRELLDGLSLEIHTPLDYPRVPEIDETSLSIARNALLKARFWRDRTGLPSLADDTGLEVDALDGQPGVRSARYSGPDATDASNRALLLDRLADIPEGRRTARFRTVVAFVSDTEHLFEGVCEGEIMFAESGDGGFGYDSLFRPHGQEKTFAEMDLELKNRISHRGRAIRSAVGFLREHFGHPS